MMPPMMKEMYTALPEMALASPSKAKIPAPTMAPMPMETADQKPMGLSDLYIP